MAAIGVVPSENSSGEKEQRGRITKTGNNHIRRVLIESSWHYQHSSPAGKTLKRRRQSLPAQVLEIARKCDQRLNQKFRRMVNRGKDREKRPLPSDASSRLADEIRDAVEGLPAKRRRIELFFDYRFMGAHDEVIRKRIRAALKRYRDLYLPPAQVPHDSSSWNCFEPSSRLVPIH